MTTFADITGIAAATGAANSYVLTTMTKVSQGQTVHCAKLIKRTTAVGAATSQDFGGYGEGPTIAIATLQALTSLNNNRRHRYGGSPGLATSGVTVVANQHGDALTKDSTS